MCSISRSHTLRGQEIVPLFTAWVHAPGQGKIAIFRQFQLFQGEMQDYECVRKMGMVRSLTHKLVLIYTVYLYTHILGYLFTTSTPIFCIDV